MQGDVLRGGPGDDTLVGDQSIVVPTAAESLGAVHTTSSGGSGFAVEPERAAGTIIPVVTLLQPQTSGDDILLGEAGRDSIHGGAGNDLANSGDDDVVFCGDGADVLWGGTGHDVLFGEAGNDRLDIKARPADPTLWTLVRPSVDGDGTRATVNGADTIYGGSGADGLQADVGDQARAPGDRLMDWTGTSNPFLVCTGAYGAGKVLTASDPATQRFLTDLANATGSVGGGEVALVKAGGESSPKYPGAPGNFVCEP